MEEIWRNILRYRGETFYTKRRIPFTYSQGQYGHMYVDTVELSFPLSYNEFQKAFLQGRKDGPSEYENVVATSYIFAILHDPRIGAWN